MTSTDQKNQPLPSTQIVEEVAGMKEVATTELSPLYETIDAEALDTLLQSVTGREVGAFRIQFQYEGYTVAVDSGGGINVNEDGR
ncbi:HalOD1 output domain-containing protein [Natrinema salaciae]|uniref:Halobacterial output domain-containing protein n=1 Tax=Natrinema salaciae TaxID=1186196 RepID=A0A1H9A3C9_9EURY|nr:HalOD1 output domain-containing protein [Natrinema salaciae]SEP70508.1 hypothetical protein SAMN04489841_0323 [Natrinema salaciae]